MIRKIVGLMLTLPLAIACTKNSNTNNNTNTTPPAGFNYSSLKVNGKYNGYSYYGANLTPIIQFNFSAPVSHGSATSGINFTTASGNAVPFTVGFQNNDSTLSIQPSLSLLPLTQYIVSATTALQSKSGGNLETAVSVNLVTAIDSSDKFPQASDDALLDLIQQQTFKYFWDFGHPVSGLARERNSSGDVVTTGGSGFGIMAMVVAVNRNFISRSDGITRLQKILDFLGNKAQRFHGAYPHWMNGNTGAVVPFSTKDDGADLVETSYLMQGLLTARQYFNGASGDETAIRTGIDSLWKGVQWSWFRQNDQNVLYWHWSPDYSWDMNMPIHGWNEALITYILAASSPTYPIPRTVYDNGWALNGNIRNGKTFYGYVLPLGPDYGGPLFFSHYTFLGVNPFGLTDTYANYETQVTNHTRINYSYCVADPKGYYGYSDQCWGLTASDMPNGYTASSPTNDVGVIAPTAAISSLPYTPAESMKAIRFFYYKLGDKLWGQYGFYDAFTLQNPWFSNSYLAIDQGPEIVMIENYRTQLLWKLFMSCPEIKSGLTNLGFQSPNL